MNDTTSKQERARKKAESQFTRPTQEDKDQAMAEYRAEAEAARRKTERLRELRLAKEAAEGKAAAKKKAAARKKPAAKKAPARKAPARRARSG